MEVNKKFQTMGRFLKKRREDQNVTQKLLADLVGCHAQFVSNIERGLCIPPTAMLPEWLKALNIGKDEWIELELKLKKEELERILSQMKVPSKKRRTPSKYSA